METNSILEQLNKPEELEKMYREDKKGFEKAFDQLPDELEDNQLYQFWRYRLQQEKPELRKSAASPTDILILLIACFVACLLIKLPSFFTLTQTETDFYQKNSATIVFFGMSLFAVLKTGFSKKIHWIWFMLFFLVPAVYINLLPSSINNDTVTLVYLHLYLLMWCLYGIIFIGMDYKRHKRMDFIRYNGDLVVLTTIILIAGGVFSGITVGLFGLIGWKIEVFYFNYIAVWGLVSAPIVATYIIKNHALVTNKIAPIIANIFSPLVLLMLVVYLVSIPFSGKDPYNDREFLLVFNMLLLGVMAIIIFSVSETSKSRKQSFSKVILFLMALAAMIINLVALSAIIYRLGEFGFTPNRTAVLGSNIVLFVHLAWITVKLFQVSFKSKNLHVVENAVAVYLPVYAIWTAIVVFTFPFIFGVD